MSTGIFNVEKFQLKQTYPQLRFSSYLRYLYIQFYRKYCSFITTKDKKVDFEVIQM